MSDLHSHYAATEYRASLTELTNHLVDSHSDRARPSQSCDRPSLNYKLRRDGLSQFRPASSDLKGTARKAVGVAMPLPPSMRVRLPRAWITELVMGELL